MKINLPNRVAVGAPSSEAPAPRRKGVVIGNITVTKERIDMDGNVIDPRSKQIIKRNQEEKLIIN